MKIVFTGSSAPYPLVTLVCNHQLSLMAYIGILTKGDLQSSERISCPLCRSNLEIKLSESIKPKDNQTTIEINPTKILLQRNIIQDIIQDKIENISFKKSYNKPNKPKEEEFYSFHTKFLSTEAYRNLCELLITKNDY